MYAVRGSADVASQASLGAVMSATNRESKSPAAVDVVKVPKYMVFAESGNLLEFVMESWVLTTFAESKILKINSTYEFREK